MSDKINDKYPKELVGNRLQLECDFIFALWQEPDNIGDYKKKIQNGKDILTEDGVLYYGILKGLYDAGYETYDGAAVEAFLSDKKTTRDEFDRYGGMATVDEIVALIKPDNIDTYYDELAKNNMLLNLYDSGFDVMKNISKFKLMNAEGVYNYYDAYLNAVCVDRIEKLKIEDLSDGYEEYIAEWDKGKMLGFPIKHKRLNSRLAGIHKSNLLLHLAGIGQGKTSTAIEFYILPAIENGDHVCIIANEQGVSEFRQMILSTVVFNKIETKSTLNRQKFFRGNFSDEDKRAMKDGVNWLRNQKGKITFVETPDYSIGLVKKIVRKYAKFGCGLFVFDTLKPALESSERAWAEFSEVAKELFMISKKEDVAIIATAQLSSEASHRRFLDLSCVGKSRAIAETATQVVMFRPVMVEEKTPDSKHYLKPYNMERDESGKYTNKKEYFDLDPNKDYIVLFTPKNRFGEIGSPIVFERNMAFNSYVERGFCDIRFDGFN